MVRKDFKAWAGTIEKKALNKKPAPATSKTPQWENGSNRVCLGGEFLKGLP